MQAVFRLMLKDQASRMPNRDPRGRVHIDQASLVATANLALPAAGTMSNALKVQAVSLAAQLVEAFLMPSTFHRFSGGLLLTHTTVIIPWDIDHLISRLSPKPTGRNEAVEAQPREQFGPLDPNVSTRIQSPRTIVDRYGRILAWVVPSAFDTEQQVSTSIKCTMRTLTSFNQHRLYMAGQNLNDFICPPKEGTSWRTQPTSFLPKVPENEVVSGTLNISPAWYPSGHEVCALDIDDANLSSRPLFRMPPAPRSKARHAFNTPSRTTFTLGLPR